MEQKECSKGLKKYRKGNFHLLWRKEDARGIPKRNVLDQVVLTIFISDLKKKEMDKDKFAGNAVTSGVQL